MSTEIAATSGFATITSATSLSPKSKTLSIISRSPSSICALLRGAGEEHPQLGLRVHLALGARRLEAEALQDRSVVHRRNQITGRKTTKNAADGRRHPERRPLRVAECRALRHELAEDDMEEAEDGVGEDDGEEGRHPLVELARQRRLAEGADAQRRERDAELHRRDEAARIAGDSQHVARAAVALVLELDDPRTAGRDEAVLRGHEERVEQDQDRDPDQLKRRVTPSPRGRRY